MGTGEGRRGRGVACTPRPCLDSGAFAVQGSQLPCSEPTLTALPGQLQASGVGTWDGGMSLPSPTGPPALLISPPTLGPPRRAGRVWPLAVLRPASLNLGLHQRPLPPLPSSSWQCRDPPSLFPSPLPVLGDVAQGTRPLPSLAAPSPGNFPQPPPPSPEWPLGGAELFPSAQTDPPPGLGR